MREEDIDFYALPAQVVDLLQSRGWVSYRALQRHSELDDAYLDDLEVELIDAQHLARDENSSILVWLGGAETVPSPPSPSSLPTPQPAMQEVGTALFFAAQVHGLRREWQRTYKKANSGARAPEFAFRVAQVEQGQGEAGLTQICQGLAALRATGSETGGILSCWPWHMGGWDRWRKGCGWPRRRSLSAAQGQSCIGSRACCC